MMWTTLKRLVREDDGMEMIEWAIVATVFAVASASLWGVLATSLDVAITATGDCVEDGTGCSTP